MAALMRHGVFKIVGRTASSGLFSIEDRALHGPPTTLAPRTRTPLAAGRLRPLQRAHFATKAEKKKGLDRKVPPKIDFTAQSIAAKGFLRAQRSYSPPPDVDERLEAVFKEAAGTADAKTALHDLDSKFRVCTACAKEFDHHIPNSLLYTMDTLNDVKEFYKTPVDARTPLDRMRNMDLPENLHVQFEYHRFHPETDTMFQGQTAFNRSSTLVTGLKYKDKYKGHIQKTQWPFNS